MPEDDWFILPFRYRFLTKTSAVVRYGPSAAPKYRGERVSNTDCSRILQGCRAKSCFLQSPNYPGFYPRNITCYYLVKALPPPTPHFKPVIVIGQPNNRLIHVGDQDLFSRVSPEVTMHQNCPGDYISIFDGGEMKAPLLARFCGSTSLPNITSSGPEMLVVFHSDSAGRLNHPPNMVVGFELQAKVLFRKQRVETGCHFEISSFNGLMHGTIHSPSYSMPSNSSCHYHFQGRNNEVVWLYFSKYYRLKMYDENIEGNDCNNGLIIKDNHGSALTNDSSNNSSSIIKSFCNDITPPVCIRYRQKHHLTIPCSRDESFLSNSNSLEVTQKFTDSTSLTPLQYILHYEFVTFDQPKENYDPDSCKGTFTSDKQVEGDINSPGSIFKYGRGGRTFLNCSYAFHLKEDEVLQLKITELNFENIFCKSVFSTHYNSYRCLKSYPNSAVLEIVEEGWNNTLLDAGCLCDNKSIPVIHSSRAKSVVVIFTVRNMSWDQDQTHFYFKATYKFSKAEACDKNKTLSGISGIISLGNSSSTELCDILPWTISGSTTKYLYMRVAGSHPSSSSCSTKNRVIVFYDGQPVKSICPSTNPREGLISVFSSGWHERGHWHQLQQIIFRYVAKEKGIYNINWLEITRDPQPPALESVAIGGGKRHTSSGTCSSECPEIMACINESLWCDGVQHCPSGVDESSCNPSSLEWVQTLVLFGCGTALSVVAMTVLGITAAHLLRQEKIKKRKRKQAQQIMTQEVLLPLSHKNDCIYLSWLQKWEFI